MTRKKLISILCVLVIIVAMLFTVVACDTPSLMKYKSLQKQELKDYVNNLSEDSYSEENWNEISEVAKAGKKSIGNAKTELDADIAVSKAKMEIDGIAPKESDKIQDGVYFITDESWESYVRTTVSKNEPEVYGVAPKKGDEMQGGKYFIANESGSGAVPTTTTDKSKDWVDSVISGELEVYGKFYKDLFKVVVLDGEVTIVRERKVYKIEQEDNLYIGKILLFTRNIWCKDDILYIKDKQREETLQFKIDPSYKKSERAPFTIEAPQLDKDELKVDLKNNQITTHWGYDSSTMGPYGMVIDLKKAGMNDFITIREERPFINRLTIELRLQWFLPGRNYIRISYMGGPVILDDKTYSRYEKSDYTTFSIDVSAEVNIEIQKI